MEKRFTWIVRFDVSPQWVAEGFVIDDARADAMLQIALPISASPVGAQPYEIGSAVIGAPCPYDIAKEQGYGPRDHAYPRMLRDAAPLARYDNPRNVDQAITRAIAFLETIPPLADAKRRDERVTSISELRAALRLIRGEEELPKYF